MGNLGKAKMGKLRRLPGLEKAFEISAQAFMIIQKLHYYILEEQHHG